MIKIKTIVADIRRSELTTVSVTVPAWELPILEALHGRAKVEVKATGEKEIEALPDAEVEFDRLSGRYGRERREDGSIGAVLAEAVYGQYQPGLVNLQRNMEAAKVSAG